MTDGASLVGGQRLHHRQGVQVHGRRGAGWAVGRSSGGGESDRHHDRSRPTPVKISGSSTAARTACTSTHAAAVAPQAARRPRTFALAAGNTNPQGIADPPAPGTLLATETPVLAEPVSAEAAPRGNDAALASMYDVPVKKFRVDTVQRSESRIMESHTRDLSYTVGTAANRLANDSVANDKHHTEVDDLFAQWESDPLELLSLPDLGM